MASLSRKFILGAGACAVGLYVAFLVVDRVHAVSTLRAQTNAGAIPDVSVVSPHRTSPKVSLTLPGNIDAWYQAPIYPQVSGYVKMWYKDYGAHVKQGDVLAEINAPALDAEYAQAKASLASVMAKYNLASVTANRWRAMGKSQSVSGQSVSVANANEQSANAEVQAAQRNVDHFEALERFKQLVAPFDGIVTARSVNVGDYVHNGGGGLNATGSASELFTVANTDKLRLFVSVPEVFSYVLQDGMTAQVTVPQYAGRTFTAKYLTTSKGYDPNTRTAIAEFVLDNPGHLLWPGTFASVALTAKNTDANLYEIPSGSLVFEEKGMQVAVVDATSHVHYVNVQVGRMADSSTEILSGLKPTDRIINNPPADLLEGDVVHVVTPARGYNESGFASDTDSSDNDGDE
ncbi:efflux RND transporter periplasmic adaptor subunit [Gluconobacter oxydans]|uniref:efflux RND transporter periplasmic adaptor subunit n=1 Tax=Gluconobacter oxydans TaxID=442 RepID=UPI00209EF574|nr:efflux RND transporter periplasmic adaptor subunit [Gluconobacter oxydans]MCP1249523.1 efflux RND transporter periplasmic adaptor subunit [Gluconobacter oxydans]